VTSAFRSVKRVVTAQATSDGAGVRLKRSLGTSALDYLDPFLLLDEFKSDRSDDYLGGFPDHPHRGFETVTYMLAGVMEHKDHSGSSAVLTPGSVQWMTAGRGIIHSEMPRQVEGLMWGFQLWVNLPAKDKFREPRYQEFSAERIPSIDLPGGGSVKILAGTSAGIEGPVRGIATRPLYLDLSLPPGSRFEESLPQDHTAFGYVFEGAANVGDTLVQEGQLAVLSPGSGLLVSTANVGARLLILAAEPLGEPMARHGPFVMNTREQLFQAFRDYQEGRFLD
jgi:hypothetical protein